MYVAAQVLGVRLEYFISSKGEFAAGQLGGKSWNTQLPPHLSFSVFCHPGEL